MLLLFVLTKFVSVEKCKIGSTPQNDWYFFSHKDKKYPTGTRTNRATAAGFWKATGRDKVIYSSFRRIGMRKTLVFYKGRAPHGQKSDWIMHEYRLDETTNDTSVSYISPSILYHCKFRRSNFFFFLNSLCNMPCWCTNGHHIVISKCIMSNELSWSKATFFELILAHFFELVLHKNDAKGGVGGGRSKI